MIKLNENYAIDFDAYNIMLKYKSKGSKGYRVLGYYMSFDEMANSILKHTYLVPKSKVESLYEVQENMVKLKEELAGNIKELINELKTSDVQWKNFDLWRKRNEDNIR